MTPESQVRRKVVLASQIPTGTSVREVAKALGCGELIIAPDTVPFCVWVAACHLRNYPKALAQAVCVGGDCDSNAAIVGGIVALSAESIPAQWIASRERIKF